MKKESLPPREDKIPDKNNESERLSLIEQMQKQRENLYKLQNKNQQQQSKYQKIVESNLRNQKRIIKYRARIEEIHKFKDNPEYLLTISGYMNEQIQEFLITHNCHLSQVEGQQPNPDNMTYEELLALGDKIGKVSKGLTKQEVQQLKHFRSKKQEQCPICCHEMGGSDDLIELRCLHAYHDECILEWLKDENTCPLCKKNVCQSKQNAFQESLI